MQDKLTKVSVVYGMSAVFLPLEKATPSYAEPRGERGWHLTPMSVVEYDYSTRGLEALRQKLYQQVDTLVLNIERCSPNDFVDNSKKKTIECMNCDEEFIPETKGQCYCAKCQEIYFDCGCERPYCLCYTR